MEKSVEINTAIYKDDGFNLEFDIEDYLIEREVGHATYRLGSQLGFTLFNVDKVTYDLFIEYLKKSNLIFIEN